MAAVVHAVRTILVTAALLLTACVGGLGALTAPARAALPDHLEFKSTDRVFWKGKGGENFLILNIFAHDERTKALSQAVRNKLLLDTALVEGARTFAKAEHAGLDKLSMLIVSMKDMSEYGGASGNWTKVATGTLVKGSGKVELQDVEIEGDKPSPPLTLAFPIVETSTAASAEGVRFLPPETIYMVAGETQSLFYENLITVKDPDEFLFVPLGAPVGFAIATRRSLTFSPTEAHVGEHQLDIKINDWENKSVAEAHIKVIVVKPDAGSKLDLAEPLRILIIGHSLPSMYWPGFLGDFLAGPGNPPVSFVGGIKYWYGMHPNFKNKPPIETMAHQASPGYSVNTLLNLYTEEPPANPNMPSRSPFIFKDASGTPKLDMKRYLDEALKGKPPHIILLNVGDNDTFNLDPDVRDSPPEKEFVVNLNIFLDRLREFAPNATIGAMMPNTYNYTDRSFLSNYGPNNSRWKQVRNRQTYIENFTRVAAARGDVKIIPSNFVVDGIDGMTQNSGTHFNAIGARQFAGSAYAWLKYQFAKQDKAAAAPSAPAKPAQSAAVVKKTAAPAPALGAAPASPAPPAIAVPKSWIARSLSTAVRDVKWFFSKVE